MPTQTGRLLLERHIYLLVRAGTEYIIPYTDERLTALLRLQPYGEAFPAFLQRFFDALSQPGWPAGSYYPGGLFRRLQAGGADPAGAVLDTATLSPFFLPEIVVQPGGRWTMEGRPILGKVATLFLQNLHYDQELARYFLRYAVDGQEDVRYLRHLAPPLRVRRVLQPGPRVLLNSGEDLPLRPESLRLDGQERLFCAVRPEGLPAEFEDAPRWAVLEDGSPEAEGWRLSAAWGGVHLIPGGQDWPYLDALPG